MVIVLPILIFVAMFLIGYPISRFFSDSRTGGLLVAPTIGTAAFVSAGTTLTSLNIKLSVFATIFLFIVVPVSAISSALLLHKRRFDRDAFPALAILIVSFLSMAYPLLFEGLNWVGFPNADMSIRDLVALSFLDFGRDQQKPSSSLQLTHAFAGMPVTHPGTPTLIGTLSNLAHLPPSELNMSILVFAYLLLICATSAMAYTIHGSHAGLATLILISSSALTRWSAFIQHIDQILGLSFLVVAVSFFTGRRTKPHVLGEAVIVGLMSSAVLDTYFPLLLYLIVAMAFDFIASIIRNRTIPRTSLQKLLVAPFVAVVCGQQTTIHGITYFLGLFGSSADELSVSAGGAFLLPSGLPDFWGLSPHLVIFGDPLESVLIAASIALFIIAIIVLLQRLKDGGIDASVSIFMLLTSIYFFHKRSDYALYKSAMYIQPFITSSLASLLVFTGSDPRRWRPRTNFVWASVGILALCSSYSDFYYTHHSLDLDNVNSGRYIQIYRASSSGFLHRLDFLSKRVSKRITVLSNTTNQIVAHYEIMAFDGDRLLFPAAGFDPPDATLFKHELRFDNLHDHLPRGIYFHQLDTSFLTRPYLLLSDPLNIINDAPTNHSVELIASQKVINYLIPVDCTIAHVSNVWGPGASLYNLERDPTTGASFQALGRYNLFQVVNPSHDFRLRISVSQSSFSDPARELPPIRIIGRNVTHLHLYGSGFATAVSSTIIPRTINGAAYILLDLGRNSIPFPDTRTGLMRLYGTDIPSDPRKVVTFARLLRAQTRSDDSRLRTRVSVGDFHSDPADLELSGFYEDGWMSEIAVVGLSPASTSHSFHLDFMYPQFPGSPAAQRFTILVDGKVARSFVRTAGALTLTVDKLTPGKHFFTLTCQKPFILPNRDGRSVCGFFSRASYD